MIEYGSTPPLAFTLIFASHEIAVRFQSGEHPRVEILPNASQSPACCLISRAIALDAPAGSGWSPTHLVPSRNDVQFH